MPSCKECTAQFTVEKADLDFYEKVSPLVGEKTFSIPPPTLCPDCRLQRRAAWRVERDLHFRTCDATGKRILSIFPPDSPFKIYHHEAWSGDSWDAKSFGRPFDFSRPFSVQFRELMEAVPLLALNIQSVQNCEFVNQCGWSKNCYMTIEADQNEDSMYGYRVFFVKNCVDCTEVVHSQQCYECVDCDSSFRLLWSQLCKQCSDSSFLYDCRGCSDCFGCAGLRQKRFHMFNKQLSEQEYREAMKTFDYGNPAHFAAAWKQFQAVKLALPRRAFIGDQNENVTGNYIYESKDALDSFAIRACRDVRYCDMVRESKDCMDYLVWGANAELLYECECCGYNAQNLRFCCDCWEGVHDLLYCYQCIQSTSHCFGCVGLKHAKYCILNKEYTKEEYESLLPKIIDHMKKGNEWGEFFSVQMSPFAYNASSAQDYFPLTPDHVRAKGWTWKEKSPSIQNVTGIPPPTGSISAITDGIVNDTLACEASGQLYRITMKELQFYRELQLPIPRLHPDERHRRRAALRNPRKLWDRSCADCKKPIKTSYAPDRPEKVVCEECYLKEVY